MVDVFVGSLFAAQRFHRIDTRCATRWHIGCQQRSGRQDERDGRERHDIDGAHADNSSTVVQHGAGPELDDCQGLRSVRDKSGWKSDNKVQVIGNRQARFLERSIQVAVYGQPSESDRPAPSAATGDGLEGAVEKQGSATGPAWSVIESP